MNKKQESYGKTICLSQRSKAEGQSKYKLKMLIGSIPSIKEAEERIKDLEKRHKWKKQRRLKMLQQTYDQNCRLYFSINSQKSTYAFSGQKPKTSINSTQNRSRKAADWSRRYYNNTDMEIENTLSYDTAKKKVNVQNTINEPNDQYRVNVRDLIKKNNKENIIAQKQNGERECASNITFCPKINNRHDNSSRKVSLKVNKKNSKLQEKNKDYCTLQRQGLRQNYKNTLYF